MNKHDIEKWQKVIIHAWKDESFKKELCKNPKQVLEKEGLTLPKGMEIEVVENTDRRCYFVLPKQPEGELTEENLRKAAGGDLSNPHCQSH